ncbi:MAG: NUDIX hydrolase [Acetobacteraceae bacterium]
MPDIGSARPPTLIDTVWQLAYRIGFPLACLWWRLSRRRHEGALVAICVDGGLLLLRSSYRAAWNLPGGTVHPGEAPDAAVRRELSEEIGLATDQPLQHLGTVTGLWEGRRDCVHLFELHLPALPPLRLDNREIIAARLVPWTDLAALALTGPVRAYVDRRLTTTTPDPSVES